MDFAQLFTQQLNNRVAVNSQNNMAVLAQNALDNRLRAQNEHNARQSGFNREHARLESMKQRGHETWIQDDQQAHQQGMFDSEMKYKWDVWEVQKMRQLFEHEVQTNTYNEIQRNKQLGRELQQQGLDAARSTPELNALVADSADMPRTSLGGVSTWGSNRGKYINTYDQAKDAFDEYRSYQRRGPDLTGPERARMNHLGAQLQMLVGNEREGPNGEKIGAGVLQRSGFTDALSRIPFLGPALFSRTRDINRMGDYLGGPGRFMNEAYAPAPSWMQSQAAMGQASRQNPADFGNMFADPMMPITELMFLNSMQSAQNTGIRNMAFGQ